MTTGNMGWGIILQKENVQDLLSYFLLKIYVLVNIRSLSGSQRLGLGRSRHRRGAQQRMPKKVDEALPRANQAADMSRNHSHLLSKVIFIAHVLACTCMHGA